MKDAISLGVGEPDFDTPWQIREAVSYAPENEVIITVGVDPA